MSALKPSQQSRSTKCTRKQNSTTAAAAAAAAITFRFCLVCLILRSYSRSGWVSKREAFKTATGGFTGWMPFLLPKKTASEH